MADFCSQCSMDMWGFDSKDLSLEDSRVNPNTMSYCLCEDCGPTIVDVNGVCLGDCTKHHGSLRVQTMEEYVKGVIPKNA